MKINVFYRSDRVGPSIRRVFDAIVPQLERSFTVTKVEMPDPRAGLSAIARNFTACLRAPRAAVNHITGDVHYCVLAFRRRTTVLTVHDVTFWELEKGIRRWLKWLLWLWLPVKYARRVVCISEETRTRLLGAVKTDPAKVSVITNPLPPAFEYVPAPFNAACPRILHIGTKPHKNLERVIRALEGIPCHLRIVGPVNETAVALLERTGTEYSSESFLSGERILEEYRASDIVSFPSLCEGFGMPIIEGQATGRAVVTSDRSPMRDVAADAAWLADPEDEGSIRAAFEACIGDAPLREKRITAGLENARRFSAQQVAGQYAAIYETYGK